MACCTVNIHMAHFIIDGAIRSATRLDSPDKPDSLLDPDAIAQTYLNILRQPRSAWISTTRVLSFPLVVDFLKVNVSPMISVVWSASASDTRQPVNRQMPNKARSRGEVNPSLNSSLNSSGVRIFPCSLPLTFIADHHSMFFAGSPLTAPVSPCQSESKSKGLGQGRTLAVNEEKTRDSIKASLGSTLPRSSHEIASSLSAWYKSKFRGAILIRKHGMRETQTL